MKGVIAPDASYWKAATLLLIITALGCSTSPSPPSDTQAEPRSQSELPQTSSAQSNLLTLPR